MLGRAFDIYRRNLGALVLTCGLSLIPANLLMSGAVMFGLAGMGAGGVAEARTHTDQVLEKQRKLDEKPPDTLEDREVRLRQIGREAFEGKAAFDANFLRDLLSISYAVLIGVAILLAGLCLAQAAVVPLVFDLRAGRPSGPARAWGAVASRFGALVKTALYGVPLIALGCLFLIVPGFILAMGFSFAIPVAVAEGLSGRAALERSWSLCSGRWKALFGIWLLIAIFTVLASAVSAIAPAGPWRSLLAGFVRVVTYPIPLIALVLLYQRAVSTSAAAPRPDSSARGWRDSPPP